MPGHLLADTKDIVRPFIGEAGARRAGRPRQASPTASAAAKLSCAACADIAARPQDKREIEIARRREPAFALTAAPGALRAGPDQRALGRTRPRASLRLVIVLSVASR